MVSWDMSISIYLPGRSMVSIPANCPADVRVRAEINTACHHLYPIVCAIMPNVKLTLRYPSPIGIPAFSPLVKFFISNI